MRSGVPIKKVRLLRRDATICPVRGRTQWVKPGNNHHVEILKATDDKSNGQFFGLVISTIEAARRTRDGQHVVNRDHGEKFEFICSLSIGEAVLLNDEKGSHLCIVQKISGPSTLAQRPFDIHLRLHTDARQKGKSKAFIRVRALRDFRFRKVTVDCIGRVRWAKD
jgi:hypothetical protein